MDSDTSKTIPSPATQISSKTPLSAWLLLGLAICFEITGAIALRFSEGFTIMLPTAISLTAFFLALYVVSHVMKSLPVSVAYPVWAGGGTAGVALLGIVMLGESITPLKLLGLALVFVGVILINRVSEKTSGC